MQAATRVLASAAQQLSCARRAALMQRWVPQGADAARRPPLRAQPHPSAHRDAARAAD